MTPDPAAAAVTAPSRTTLAMLADEAGVSLSTVSKVLNGRSDVSPGTRVAVERLLDAHSYRRRGSSAHESTLIELVFSDITNPWGSEIVSGVQDVARDEGMSVLLTPTAAPRAEPGPDWLPAVMRRRPVGVLVVSTEPESRSRERLLSRNIPVVVVDPAGELAPGVPSVGSTNWNGGLAAARHLLELGHRDIAAITGPAEMLCSHARLDGFRSAMAAAGAPMREEWVHWGDFEAAGGRRAAEAFLAGPGPRPTAVFAGNDVQALGVIEAAERLGIRVPQDLSVVGYDDTPVATWARPPLTTVHQPIRRMAAEATRIMLRLARGEPVAQPRLELATHLVVRGSTARRT